MANEASAGRRKLEMKATCERQKDAAACNPDTEVNVRVELASAALDPRSEDSKTITDKTLLRRVASDVRADLYWQKAAKSYSHYPTVRHRWRFILKQLRGPMSKPGAKVYDYGCGEGGLLVRIQSAFRLLSSQLHGCDISAEAVNLAAKRLPGCTLEGCPPPSDENMYDAIVCCEVIEHTPDFGNILHWISRALMPGGTAVVTTQAGTIHASDRYTGHTQHFRLGELVEAIEALGLQIEQAYAWGFPFFTLQKYLTDFRFGAVRASYLEGELSIRKRIVFAAANFVYFLHDFVPCGPQLYIVARKPIASHPR